MKASLKDQLQLLELQQVETQLSQVRHRAATHPIARQVQTLSDQLSELRRQIVQAQTSGDDLQRAVNRSEDELERVRKRLQRDRELVDQGASARAQRELEHELTSLARRLSDLEDAELEMLSQQEQMTATVVQLTEQEVRLRGQLGESRTQQESDAGDAAAKLAELAQQQAALAASVDPQLLRMYQGIRKDTPIAVAELAGNQCGGCRLQLPPSELAQLRAGAPDEIATCEECGCILVRA